MSDLILASSSRYRAQLLQRLKIPFTAKSPNLDETALDSELPEDLALRLAKEKANKIHKIHRKAVIIGSDQVCAYEGSILGKPLTEDQARKQLQSFSDNCINFFTAICVLTAKEHFQHIDKTTVHFRKLSDDEIDRYIEIEQPLDCAGAFKVEGMGISLFKSIQSEDPTALVGLPMIKLSEFLRQAEYMIP